MAPEDSPEDDASAAPPADEPEPSSPPASDRSASEGVHPIVLWMIPVVAVLYVIFVVLLASGSIPLFMEVGTAVGLGVALLLGLLVALILLGRSDGAEEDADDASIDDEEDEVWSAYDDEPDPGEPPFQEGVDFTWGWEDGVATLTHPPQDPMGDAAIYFTTEVPVDEELDLHLEEQVARNPSAS